MQGDEQLRDVFIWFFREFCRLLRVENGVTIEEKARRRFDESLEMILDLLQEQQTERTITDALVSHGKYLHQLSPEEVAYRLALGIVEAELQEMSSEVFQRMPPEVRQAIIEAIEEHERRKAGIGGPSISLN